ncbi:MAG: hypothetical protein HYY31_04580 [Chloroflexi bacterium]|nr:hypothetical protein [Chloroflexota bacterium]
MFIEIDVVEGPNSPMSLNRDFSVVRKPQPVSLVHTAGPSGTEGWYRVTGWSGDGACQAYAAVVDDSGEGQALLIFGGDQGIRLKAASDTNPWNLADRTQWGEACLLLSLETEVRADGLTGAREDAGSPEEQGH